jgi:hypothetical protein
VPSQLILRFFPPPETLPSTLQPSTSNLEPSSIIHRLNDVAAKPFLALARLADFHCALPAFSAYPPCSYDRSLQSCSNRFIGPLSPLPPDLTTTTTSILLNNGCEPTQASSPQGLAFKMSNDMTSEQMQTKITAARREAEGLKDRIKRKKDDLADTSRTY